MADIFYNGNPDEEFFPKAALSEAAGKPVRLAHDERGFRVVLEDGTDPVAPDVEEGQEPIGAEPAWASYSSDPQPTRDWVAAWRPVDTTPPPVTDVEILYKTISERLNGDEAKRTGRPVDPNGAVPVARAMAATAMLYQRWHYPSEADLSTGNNPALLQVIYADPTANTTETSSVDQKRRVLHFTLVMLEGQAFGLEYQAELGAYERTASGQFREKMTLDKRDWLALPCPKMHKNWPAFTSVREMFQAVMS